MKLLKIIDSEILEFLNEHTEVNIPDIKKIYNRFISPVGTLEDYIQYTSGIFPNSEVKKVVYRAGLLKLNQYMGGIWFGESESDVKKFTKSVRGYSNNIIHYCLINLQNPRYFRDHWWEYLRYVDKITHHSNDRDIVMNLLISEGYDGMIIGIDTWNDTTPKYTVRSEQYVVFSLDQVYSLGTEDDINNFKIYLEK